MPTLDEVTRSAVRYDALAKLHLFHGRDREPYGHITPSRIAPRPDSDVIELWESLPGGCNCGPSVYRQNRSLFVPEIEEDA